MKFNSIYVSKDGSDRNDGSAPDKAVKTVKMANMLADDHSEIMLEGGSVFEGSFVFKDKENIRIGRYGTGMPVVRSGDPSGFTLLRCRDVVFAGIKLEGKGWTVLNDSCGVYLVSSSEVRISGLEITGFHEAGINVKGCTDTVIEGCFIHDNGSTGIHTGADPSGKYCFNTRISHCKLYDNAGDRANRHNHSGSGIIIGGADKTLVEFCEATANGWGQRQHYVNGPVGIWCCCGCTNACFRYNIARLNRTQPGAVDGDGMDIDGEANNVLFEYNYTYKNEAAGYLFCEFYGDCTDTIWHDNTLRHCFSFEDDTRVGEYGALAISSPEDIPFTKMFIERNLLVARGDKHTTYNRQLPKSADDLFITNNVLVTSGCETISNTEHESLTIKGNIELKSADIQSDIVKHAPLLTEPRDLLRQPLFGYLKDGTCGEILSSKGAFALFSPVSSQNTAKGFRMMELQMYGPDFDGTEKTGDVVMYYDTIASSVVTRMRGAGAQFMTPLPWWTKDRRYIVRVKARLQSPAAEAYMFLQDIKGGEVRAYLNSPVDGYYYTELPFTGNDKWFDSGIFIGVCAESGCGDLYVHSMEFIELPEGENYCVPSDFDRLRGYRSFGDAYQDNEKIVLTGGAFIEKTFMADNELLQELKISYFNEDSKGSVYLKYNDKMIVKKLKRGENTVNVRIPVRTGKVVLGVSQDVFASGELILRDVRI